MQRRGFIAAVGIALSGGASTVSAAPSRRRLPQESASPFTDLGVNTFDADGDGNVDLEVRAYRGTTGGRSGVRRITSNGVAQADYVTTVQRVPPVPLSAFASGDGEGIRGGYRGRADGTTTLTYDYYEVDGNEAATPDEIWVQVVDDSEPRCFYRASNDNDEGGPVGEWIPRKIHREITGNPVYNAGYNWFEVTPEGVSRVDESLVATVGGDATLARVGTGGSNFGGTEVVTDFYVSQLRLGGRPFGRFPANTSDRGGGGASRSGGDRTRTQRQDRRGR